MGKGYSKSYKSSSKTAAKRAAKQAAAGGYAASLQQPSVEVAAAGGLPRTRLGICPPCTVRMTDC
jgi:hypothetical protein